MDKNSWNTEIYSKFLTLRTRPAQDLLAGIPDTLTPKLVYDLGCGPGNSTIILQNRWPLAKVIGVDSSAEMLHSAQLTYPALEFSQGTIEDFSVTDKPDCLFANASLHWLKQHDELIPRLFGLLNTNGVLAIQIPNNFHSATHQVILTVLRAHPKWQTLSQHLIYGPLEHPLFSAESYYSILSKLNAASIRLWETTYFQEMPHYQAILDWVSGTVLRPILSNMDPDNRLQFSNEYLEAISQAYDTQTNGKILLPFKRLFMLISKAP